MRNPDATERPSDATQNGRLPIVYVTALDREVDIYAEERGWEPSELRKASEMAVRTRHQEAESRTSRIRPAGDSPTFGNSDLAISASLIRLSRMRS